MAVGGAPRGKLPFASSLLHCCTVWPPTVKPHCALQTHLPTDGGVHSKERSLAKGVTYTVFKKETCSVISTVQCHHFTYLWPVNNQHKENLQT